MYTLVAFATQWGSKHGGINSFNTDFLAAFGLAFQQEAQLFCIVADADEEAIQAAKNTSVTLLPLPYRPANKALTAAEGQAGVQLLQDRSLSYDPQKTIWLGHDRITGAAAIAAADRAGGRSALIHHMSYDHYESYAEKSTAAHEKAQEQRALFQRAALALAVGPLLRDALTDLLGGPQTRVHMMIPGLAEIEPRQAPKTFTAFLSGRLSNDAAKIKQGHLGVATFAQACGEARESGMPECLCRGPKLVLRGVDFERSPANSAGASLVNSESELKEFAETFAGAVINLHALPYTQDREQLYRELSGASLALMPSWHEGFGLVAWEAIAAGVPLILSRNSGAYRLLEENHPGAGTGCVYPLAVRGQVAAPFFHEQDLKDTVALLNQIAAAPEKARQQAATLREMVGQYTWTACAEQAAAFFDWPLHKGSIPNATPTQSATTYAPPLAHTALTSGSTPLYLPPKNWRFGIGLADSQLLRAEEEIVPFDPARQPDLEALNHWLDSHEFPLAVRLMTGVGGVGKTRLALELCRLRLESGWLAGLLDNAVQSNGDMASAWRALQQHSPPQPLLIVIDYAETRQKALLSLINAMMAAPRELPTRVLLLARDGGEWWDNLPSQESACESLLSGYATTGPYALLPLHAEHSDLMAAYHRALRAFAETLRVPAPNGTPELKGEHFRRPLYLQMAALLALHGERPTTAEGLTKALLNHERRYWQGILTEHHGPEPVRQAHLLLTLATLAGGFATPREAKPYWEQAIEEKSHKASLAPLFATLKPLYPGKQGLEPVRPDLLGEALVAQALLQEATAQPLLAAVLSSRANQSTRRHALTVLARLSNHRPDLHEVLVEALAQQLPGCCQDLVAVGIATQGNLPSLAERAFSRLSISGKRQSTGLLKPLLREKSIQFAGLTCLIDGFLAEQAHERWQQVTKKRRKDTEEKAAYASCLVNYSNSLVLSGDKASLHHAEHAQKLFHELVQVDQNRFEFAFATSLNNLANRLSDAGKNEEALQHAQQAMDIYKRLANKNPDRFEPDLAISLSNLANHLSDAGKNEEALQHAQQAMDICKRLAEKNPDRFEPDLAISLSNLANHLSDAGKNEEALQHAQQAMDICKRLAEKNPDRFEPDFANSLNTLANRLSDAGKIEEARQHTQQAMHIRQRLANNNPDRFGKECHNTTCNALLLGWLAASAASKDTQPFFPPLPENIPAHQHLLSQLYAAFVQGCLTREQGERSRLFDQVLAIHNQLIPAARIDARPYWLCAAAWCATFPPPAPASTDWQADWTSYSKERQGNIPWWMAEIARRLQFQWPPASPSGSDVTRGVSVPGYI